MGGSDEYAEMKKMGGRKGKRAQNHDGGSSLKQMGGADECYKIIIENGTKKMFEDKVVLDDNEKTVKVQIDGSDEMVCPEEYAEVSDKTIFKSQLSQGGRRRRRKSKKALKVSRKSRKSRRGRKSRKN